MLGIPP